jgi:hypothetical protein
VDGTTCSHEGYHGIRTDYDRRTGILVYFWTCELCGTRLDEVRREEYRPRFEPFGQFGAVPAPR